MNALRMKRPSPAFVVAMVALFVALGGTAGAVVNAAVPLAKRALVADNATKVGGLTAAQLGTAAAQAGAKVALGESPAGPRPASTAASLITVKQTPFVLGAGAQGSFTATCDAGQKAIAGGYVNPVGTAFVDTAPTSDGSGWTIYLLATDSSAAGGVVEAICLK